MHDSWSSVKSFVGQCLSVRVIESTKNPAVAWEDALQPIQFLLQYRHSILSKVNDFHLDVYV